MTRRLVLTVAGLLTLTAVTIGQRGGVFDLATRAGTVRYDGRFLFTRLKYQCFGNCYYYYGMPSWAHGYPTAEENLMKIMNAISDLHPRLDTTQAMTIDDPDLGKFPVAFMVEASFWRTNNREAKILGDYLRKGGF